MHLNGVSSLISIDGRSILKACRVTPSLDLLWGLGRCLVTLWQQENGYAACSHAEETSVRVLFNKHATTFLTCNIRWGHCLKPHCPIRESALLWLSFFSCTVFHSMWSLPGFARLRASFSRENVFSFYLHPTALSWGFFYLHLGSCTFLHSRRSPWLASFGYASCVTGADFSYLRVLLQLGVIGSLPAAYFYVCKKRICCQCCVAAPPDCYRGSSHYFKCWWLRPDCETITGCFTSNRCPPHRFYGHQRNSLQSIIWFNCRHHGLRNDEGSELVGGFSFPCTPVASLRFHPRRSFSFFFYCCGHMCHCPRRSKLGCFAHNYCHFLASYDSVLRSGSAASFCSSQRALFLPYSGSISRWDYRTHNCFYHSSFDQKPSSCVPSSPLLCYSMTRSVGYCSGYSAVSSSDRDFVVYFNICTINSGFFFSSSCIFLPSFTCSCNHTNFDYGSSAVHLPLAFVVFPFYPSSPRAAPSPAQSSVMPEPAASSTLPCGLVTALFRERPARAISAFAELDEAFFALEDRVLKVELFLAKPTSCEANLRSQISAL